MLGKSYVYQLRCSDRDQPFYIGKGVGNRLNNHMTKSSLSRVNRKNGVIKAALARGAQILPELLCEGLSDVSACMLEIKLIKLLGRKDLGTGILTNMTDGGEGTSGHKLSSKTRQKISEAMKRRVVTKDTRIKLAASRMGVIVSEETRQKMSDVHRGKVISESMREALSKANLGKKMSQESVRKRLDYEAAQPKIQCPYCDKSAKQRHFSRYHGDNCKYKEVLCLD